MPRSRGNRGLIGSQKLVTTISASGVHSILDQLLLKGAGTWPAPVFERIQILLIAGGASGTKSGNGGSPGGGAGGYIEHPSLAVTTGVSYSITIGGGGAGSSPAAGTFAANDGSNSTFGSLLTAVGGGSANKQTGNTLSLIHI